MNNFPFFSLIIPYYNVEQYIQKCLHSVKNQKFMNFEAIFVDDGSTDRSLQIIQNSIAELHNIKIIRQENGGISSARNAGIGAAKGKYIWFIDSDDWIADDALSILKNKLQEGDVDMLGFSNYHFFENEKRLNDNLINEESGVLTNLEVVAGGYRHETAPWIYVFNRAFLKNTGITFREDVTLHEDEFFLSSCLLNARKIKFIDDKLYFHRIREGSLMRTKNTRAKLYAFSELSKLYQTYIKLNPLSGYWSEKLFNLNLLFYRHYFSLSDNEKKLYSAYLKHFRAIKLRPGDSDNNNKKLLKAFHNRFFLLYKYFILK